MSRNAAMGIGLALVCAIAALVLQFTMQTEGVSEADFEALQEDVAQINEQSALRVAYVNAENAFTVFTTAVADQRRRATEKAEQVTELRQEYLQGTISQDDYQQQLMELQAELLDAQLAVEISMMDRMAAGEGFSDIRGDVTALKEEAQPVVDEMKNLLSATQTGVISTAEFENRYGQLEAAYTQLDQLLVSLASNKIVQAAQEISLERGYDLVLRAKNVIIYRNPAALVDITDLVRSRLSSYL